MQREPKRTAFTRLERERKPPPPMSSSSSSSSPLRTPRQSQPCSASRPSEPPSQPPHPRQPPEVIAENILDLIVLMQLFRLIMEIHFSSGVDLDTLFEALEQLFEPQPIDPNMFNPTEPKIHLPRLRRQRRLKTAAKARKSRRRSACQRHGRPEGARLRRLRVQTGIRLRHPSRRYTIARRREPLDDPLRPHTLRRDPLQLRRTPSLPRFGRPERQGRRHFQ